MVLLYLSEELSELGCRAAQARRRQGHGEDEENGAAEEEEETGFTVMLQGSELPEYKAELDPYCPRAGAEV